MLIWLLSNIGLSLIALLFIVGNSSAPHRMRFYVALSALLSWLLPWQKLSALLSTQWLSGFKPEVLPDTLQRSADYLQSMSFILVSSEATDANQMTLTVSAGVLILTGLSLIGCLLFSVQLYRHSREIRLLQRESSEGAALWSASGIPAKNVQLRIQTRVNGAFTTGLLKPCIWVHQNLSASEQLNTLLQHELTHVRQHDNAYLMVVTFIEKLFWWNPLVRLLGNQARELVELSCDEQCRAQDTEYPVRLASLILQNVGGYQGSARALVSANIFGKDRANIRRIQSLQRNYAMKKRHIVSSLLSLTAALGCVALVSAQADVESDLNVEKKGFFLKQFITLEESENGDTGSKKHLEIVYDPQNSFMPVDAGGYSSFSNSYSETGEMLLSMKLENSPLLHALQTTAIMLKFNSGNFTKITIEKQGAEQGERTMFIKDAFSPEEETEAVQENGSNQGHGIKIIKSAQVSVDINTKLGRPDNLLLEEPKAAGLLVSADIQNSDIDQVLDQLGAASGCNIFRENGNIVVDYCD